MPYSLTIDETLGCAFIKWTGIFSLDEAQAFYRDQANQAGFRRCLKRFHDVREVDFAVTATEIRRVAKIDTP